MEYDLKLEKEISPLSSGFISKGNIYFNVKYKFTKDFTFYNRLGNDLIDFVWMPSEVIRKTFELIFSTSLAIKVKYDEPKMIAMILLERFSNILMVNSYFSFYLFAYIDYLASDELDIILFDEDERYLFTVSTDDVTEIFISSIFKRQELINTSLTKVLIENNSVCPKPLLRFYELEQTDPIFKVHWKSDFITKIGKRDTEHSVILQLTELTTIDDAMRYELVQLLLRNTPYKLCKCCGKLFIPTGRKDSLYCNRITPGYTKPCKEIGANLVAKEKLSQNPVKEIYRKAYLRLKKRVDTGYMTEEEFNTWNDIALPKRNACDNGEVSFENFKKWIDESSRKR